jgi:hypothetical protein
LQLKNLSLKDFAIFISDYLFKSGINAVLSGGACVSIYTNNKFISYDLDFVLFSADDLKKAGKALTEIGFYEENRYFRRNDTEYFIDFVSPPLSVGEEPVKEVAEIKKGDRTLKLLSVTDCVKDRLAAYYHWNDRQCLEQAVLVCQDNQVDFKEVERWSKNEGMIGKYKTFKEHLKEKIET